MSAVLLQQWRRDGSAKQQKAPPGDTVGGGRPGRFRVQAAGEIPCHDDRECGGSPEKSTERHPKPGRGKLRISHGRAIRESDGRNSGIEPFYVLISIVLISGHQNIGGPPETANLRCD